MRKKNITFKHFTCAGYATDVTFQQSFRPSGSVQEGKRVFSGKHKLYGFKVEMSVLPTNIAIDCTRYYPGSVSDFEIFKENIRFHKCSLKQTIEEREEADIGIHSGQSPEHWGILVDKGYQGALEICRAAHLNKKPHSAFLSLDDERFNRQVSSDCIIVEITLEDCVLCGQLSTENGYGLRKATTTYSGFV